MRSQVKCACGEGAETSRAADGLDSALTSDHESPRGIEPSRVEVGTRAFEHQPYRVKGQIVGTLSGTGAGQHSTRINDEWRVCFRWTKAGPEEVTITD